MNTLNDKWLEKANKTTEKKKRIKQNRDKLNSNEPRERETARNNYINEFWNNKRKNGEDYVRANYNNELMLLRFDRENDKIEVIYERCDFLINKPEEFYEKLEKIFTY